jgi:guanosine-3',5'-bis(diphosphate) 3'-pyrophosphohydrolase
MGSIKWELEDLCLKVLEPDFYGELVEKIDLKRDQRQEVIELAIRPLREKLQTYEVKHRIFGRPQALLLDLEQDPPAAQDLRGDPGSLCHPHHRRAAGGLLLRAGHRTQHLHAHHGPLQRLRGHPQVQRLPEPAHEGGRPGGRTLEIQIRTEEMNRVAEYGLAAHWIYKEGGDRDRQLSEFFTWIKQVLDENSSGDGHGRLPRRVQDQPLPGRHLRVQSPKGDLYKLPKGATPIDFAFAVHTNVGLTCTGARVDRRMVTLDTDR